MDYQPWCISSLYHLATVFIPSWTKWWPPPSPSHPLPSAPPLPQLLCSVSDFIRCVWFNLICVVMDACLSLRRPWLLGAWRCGTSRELRGLCQILKAAHSTHRRVCRSTRSTPAATATSLEKTISKCNISNSSLKPSVECVGLTEHQTL